MTIFVRHIVLVLLVLSGCARVSVRRMSDDHIEGISRYERNIKSGADGRLSDDQIQTVLNDNVGIDGQADSLVFGVIDERGARVLCAGTLGDGTGRKVDGDTLFEIGSITKVFTATL